jgi:hypothetical protein
MNTAIEREKNMLIDQYQNELQCKDQMHANEIKVCTEKIALLEMSLGEIKSK